MEKVKQEFATGSGVKYELYSYITLKDQEFIEEPLYASVEMKQSGSGTPEISSFKGTVIRDMQDRRYKVSVASLEGSSENIVERLKELPLLDAQEIKEKVAILTGEKKAQPSQEQK